MQKLRPEGKATYLKMPALDTLFNSAFLNIETVHDEFTTRTLFIARNHLGVACAMDIICSALSVPSNLVRYRF